MKAACQRPGRLLTRPDLARHPSFELCVSPGRGTTAKEGGGGGAAPPPAAAAAGTGGAPGGASSCTRSRPPPARTRSCGPAAGGEGRSLLPPRPPLRPPATLQGKEIGNLRGSGCVFRSSPAAARLCGLGKASRSREGEAWP